MRRWRGDPWASLLTICLGFFMTLLDLSIVNIAIPSLMTDLHTSLDQVSWVLNAYMLVLVVFLITAGRLGDMLGPKRLFIAGLVLFTISSALCGVSQGPGELIAARAVQGLGAAVMMPQTLTILTVAFPPEKRGAAFGIWGAVAGVATIAGPTLGGFLVTSFTWRWIFFINVPVGVVVFVLSLVVLEDRGTRHRHHFDIVGVSLASIGLLGLTYAVIEGQRYDWGTITGFVSIPLLIGVALVLLVLFFVQQRLRQHHEPLVPFELFRDRNYAVMNFVAAAVSVGLIGFMLPMTIYLQSVLGFSALKAGLVMAPMSVVSMFVAPVSGRLSDRIGGKFILVVGLTLIAVGFGWILAVATPTSGEWSFVPGLLVCGFGMGCTFAPMSSVAMRDIEPRVAGAASGVMNTIRQLGSVVGNTAVVVVLQNRLTASMATQTRHDIGAVPPGYRAAFAASVSRQAKQGLEAGASAPSGSGSGGVPPAVARALRQVGQQVFEHGYVDAMRPTVLLPVVVLLLGVVACLFARNSVAGRSSMPTESTAVEMGV